MSENWVDGTLESGADPEGHEAGSEQAPNAETGVGIGQDEGSTFEPEEDAAAT